MTGEFASGMLSRRNIIEALLLGGILMDRRAINPYTPTATYAAAHEVKGVSRLVFVSGQVPEDSAGFVPEAFKDQCLLAWRNVERQLQAADMSIADIAKFTIFLSDRKFQQDEYEVRRQILNAGTQPAMTIIICGIYDTRWLLEIEAIAAA